MARLSAGAGYCYLLRHTAAGDAARPGSTPLAEYYAATGYPPGRWLGSGLAGLAAGEGLAEGTLVTEDALAALYAGRDPATLEPLGRPMPTYPVVDGRRARHAVAGFDLTFTVPKSVSVLWAMADEPTRAMITQAHHQAVADALEFMEQRVAGTRAGHAGVQGTAVRGLVAAAFDHWDTRAGDPNLHTHLVIANKVQGVDGKWRSVDGRRLHKAAVAVSELYDDLLADRLAAVLPVEWSQRDRGRSRTPAFEVDGVDDGLLAEFSQRSTQVTARTRELVTAFRVERGRCPSRVERTRLAQRACRDTRPAKSPHALAGLLADWRQRARVHTDRSPHDLAAAAMAGQPVRPLLAGDIGPEAVQRLALETVSGVESRRTTWDEWNLHAEASRVTRSLRMSGTGERIRLTDMIVSAAVELCVPIDGPAPLPSLVAERTWSEARYTSRAILDAEQALLISNARSGEPSISLPLAVAQHEAAIAIGDSRGGQIHILAPDQRRAVVEVTTSGRPVDVLVGPAGTGKTMTLAVICRVWEAQCRAGVVGLAPSAAAAGELAKALGMRCETTAKWLWESNGPGADKRATVRAGLRERCLASRDGGDMDAAMSAVTAIQRLDGEQQRWQLRPGQLLIVDEAAMSGTLDLAALAEQARQAGAKLLLVGDHHQLGPVPAGGAFGMLARHGHTTSLDGLWRFSQRWEAEATRRLRAGDPACVDTYTEHGRVTGGDHETMIETAHDAWAADRAAGRSSLLIAADNATVAELNERARASRVHAGQVTATGVQLRDGTTAGVGDLVITRENQRRLRTTDGNWVRNGDTWQVTATQPDGSITVTSTGRDQDTAGRGGSIRLDPDYVAAQVQLGYAVTAHRAQGATVDTCHVLATPAMTREAFYVAMTRGRHTNNTYVSTGPMIDSEEHHDVTIELITPAEVLHGVLANEGSERSATEQIQRRYIDAGLPGMRLRPQLATPQYGGTPQHQRARPAPAMQL